MTAGNYAFYGAILTGNMLLAIEWAKYGLVEAALTSRRVILGITINTAAVLIAAISGNFPSNSCATLVPLS